MCLPENLEGLLTGVNMWGRVSFGARLGATSANGKTLTQGGS